MSISAAIVADISIFCSIYRALQPRQLSLHMHYIKPFLSCVHVLPGCIVAGLCALEVQSQYLLSPACSTSTKTLHSPEGHTQLAALGHTEAASRGHIGSGSVALGDGARVALGGLGKPPAQQVALLLRGLHMPAAALDNSSWACNLPLCNVILPGRSACQHMSAGHGPFECLGLYTPLARIQEASASKYRVTLCLDSSKPVQSSVLAPKHLPDRQGKLQSRQRTSCECTFPSATSAREWHTVGLCSSSMSPGCSLMVRWYSGSSASLAKVLQHYSFVSAVCPADQQATNDIRT